MTVPRIRYARASDGVDIAYWTLGAGVPIVLLPALYSHLQLEWQTTVRRLFYERMASHGQLVRYDRRGCGLSQRGVSDHSLDAQLRDLRAVIEQLDAERVVLMGTFHSGHVAAAYAATYPEQVSRLVLWCAFARGAEYLDTPQVRTQLTLTEQDWDFFAESAAQFWFGWSGGDAARQTAAVVREGTTPQELRATLEALADVDVTPLLGRITAPTMVVHFREMPYPSVEDARELVSTIPDARFGLFEGKAIIPAADEAEAAVRSVEDFLGVRSRETATTPTAAPAGDRGSAGGMTAILFADVVDSTALTERLGDAAFRNRARELDIRLRTIIRDHEGTPIDGKLLGDGVLATFTTARVAIEAALACATAGSDAGLPLHVGLHAGDVIREDGDIYGGAVNVAARISDESAPGEVLVSQTVRELARTSTGVAFQDGGERALKGVSEPVRVFRVLRRS